MCWVPSEPGAGTKSSWQLPELSVQAVAGVEVPWT
jgi:hypothetical protein